MIEYKSFSRELKITVKEGDAAFHKSKITRSSDINEYVRKFYNDDIELYESFFVLFLNQVHNTIGWIKLSQGGISGTVADPRLIAKYAIETLCSAVVLVHNHPSGNSNPSEQDKAITEKIKDGLKLFDIRVLDHLILTKESYYSFADEGLTNYLNQ
jgi:DNA repair protein RadC